MTVHHTHCSLREVHCVEHTSWPLQVDCTCEGGKKDTCARGEGRGGGVMQSLTRMHGVSSSGPHLSNTRGAKQLVVVSTQAMFSGRSSTIFASRSDRFVCSSSPLRIFSTTTGSNPASHDVISHDITSHAITWHHMTSNGTKRPSYSHSRFV